MPIIPRGSQNVQMNVSSPVPIAGTTDSRITGESMGQFGKSLMDFGAKQYEFNRRLSMQEATDTVNNAIIEGHAYAKQNAQIDGSDYAEKFHEYAQPRMDEAQASAPDHKSSRELSTYIRGARQHADAESMVQRAGMLEKHNFSRLESLSDSAANRVRENPKGAQLSAEVKSFNSMLDEATMSGGLSAENAVKARQNFYEKIVVQKIDGLGNMGMYGTALNFLKANQADGVTTDLDPNEAHSMGLIDTREMDALNAKGEKFKAPVLTKGDKYMLSPEAGTVVASLDPRVKSQLIDRLTAQAKQAAAEKYADLGQTIAAYGTVNNPTTQDYVDVKEKIMSNPLTTGKQKSVQMTQINAYRDIHTEVAKAMALPLSERMGVSMDTSGGSLQERAIKETAARKLQASITSLTKAQIADPKQAVINSTPYQDMLSKGAKDGDPGGVQTHINAALAAQDYFGLPRRVTTNFERTNIANNLLAIQDPGAKHAAINGLQQQYGEHFPKVMDEVAASNKDLAGYKALVYANPDTRQALVTAIQNKPVVDKAFAEIEDHKGIQSDIEAATRTQMAEFTRATLDAGGLQGQGIVNTLQEQVQMQVRAELVKSQGKGDVEKLTEKAYQDIVGNTYGVAHGGNSAVLVPKDLQGKRIDPAYIGAQMDYLTGPGLKNLNLFIDPRFQQNTDKEKMTAVLQNQGTPEEQYFSYLKGRLKWVTNNTQTGIILKRVENNGDLTTLTDKQRRPIEKSYVSLWESPMQGKTSAYWQSMNKRLVSY